MKTHIFVCHTPFQLLYAELIITHLRDRSMTHNYIVVHPNLKIQSFKSKVKYVNYGDNYKLKNCKKLIKTYKVLRRFLFDKSTNTEFYFSHISGLFPNYIFFNSEVLNNNKLNLFYEGILYLYDYNETFCKTHLKRKIASFLLGFNYKYVRKILPINSPKISCIYTPYPELTKGQNRKKVKVKFEDSPQNNSKEKGILILGGPVDYLQELYLYVFKKLTYKTKIFYKSHSSFLRENKKYLNTFKMAAQEYNLVYEEIEPTLPIELLSKNYSISEVFSYYSSSLINLSSINPQIKLNCLIKNSLDSEIRKIFQRLNIKVIKL